MSRKSSRNRPSKNRKVAPVAAVFGKRKLFGRRGLILVAIVLCASAVCGMAEWKARALTSLPAAIGHKTGYLASPTPTAPKLSKEYIYSNGSMVATVEPIENTVANVTAPTNLVATTVSTTQVSITWTASTGSLENYVVERGTSKNGSFSPVGSPTTNSFSDTTVTADNAYIYRVKAVDTTGHSSIYSNMDLAVVWTYADDPLMAGVTVKAVHINQLRSATDAARAAVGLSAATWQDTVTVGFLIRAQHITKLRLNINAALAELSLSAPTYTDPGLDVGTSIKATHITELRNALK